MCASWLDTAAPELFEPEVLRGIRGLVLEAGEVSVGDIVASTPHPKRTTLPALMHLLWRQVFVFDISRRLCPATVIRAAS